MYRRVTQRHSRSGRPAESHDVMVIADRVVELETIHVGQSVWIAKGRISESLPTGPRLRTPLEITATGDTEASAIGTLRHRVEDLASNRSG